MSGRVLFVVWAVMADILLTGGYSSGFASCLAGRFSHFGRFGVSIGSGLLQVEQQGSARLGGSTVLAPSRICGKVER